MDKHPYHINHVTINEAAEFQTFERMNITPRKTFVDGSPSPRTMGRGLILKTILDRNANILDKERIPGLVTHHAEVRYPCNSAVFSPVRRWYQYLALLVHGVTAIGPFLLKYFSQYIK